VGSVTNISANLPTLGAKRTEKDLHNCTFCIIFAAESKKIGSQWNKFREKCLYLQRRSDSFRCGEPSGRLTKPRTASESAKSHVTRYKV